VEAKEGVEIRAENDSSATITRQRYFGLYDTICGLTGTAAESAGEFWHFFEMGVETVPLHKPSQRAMLPERVFQSQEEAYQAVLRDAMERHRRGQPVLVGTRTIRASEALAEVFTEAGLPFTLLTAKQDAEESEIVARAGEPGHVLLATNMAGRGTHIDLDPASLAAGGLHVIAVERNESVRIDRQLIGRGARQGQPGSAQMFVSADDYLLEHYAPQLCEKIRKAKADEGGEVSGKFSDLIDELQQAVERLRYESRLALAQRDKWLDEIKSNLA
jgi:preprotein translocase subunit SecA